MARPARHRCNGKLVLATRTPRVAPTISCWKERFLQQRVADLLEMQHPGQKPSVITPALQAKVLDATRRKPKDGSTHWPCRKLAAQLGISRDSVQRIWRRAGLKPYRLERDMTSNHPELERKAADIHRIVHASAAICGGVLCG